MLTVYSPIIIIYIYISNDHRKTIDTGTTGGITMIHGGIIQLSKLSGIFGDEKPRCHCSR